MGKSDSILKAWYQYNIKPRGEVALLGYSSNNFFPGDLYDRSIGNWEINSSWSLPKKYDTIISTRCPYFAKDPEDFIKRCYESLNSGGSLYVDWGLGDHWRFKKYKLGWVKDNEHEYAYGQDNLLWSSIWDDDFLDNAQFKKFSLSVKKHGYINVKKSVFEEVPKVLELKTFKQYFILQNYQMLSLWDNSPQLYMLIHGVK